MLKLMPWMEEEDADGLRLRMCRLSAGNLIRFRLFLFRSAPVLSQRPSPPRCSGPLSAYQLRCQAVRLLSAADQS